MYFMGQGNNKTTALPYFTFQQGLPLHVFEVEWGE